MKFWEAMKLVDEGGTVRRKSWIVGKVEKFIDGKESFVSIVFAPDSVCAYSPSIADMVADNWEQVLDTVSE